MAIQPSNRGPRSRGVELAKAPGRRPCQPRIDPVQLGVLPFPDPQLGIVRRQPKRDQRVLQDLHVAGQRRPADLGIAGGRGDVQGLAVKQGGDRHEAREAGQVPYQRFALDLFFQVELDVGPQRGCPVVGVPDYGAGCRAGAPCRDRSRFPTRAAGTDTCAYGPRVRPGG